MNNPDDISSIQSSEIRPSDSKDYKCAPNKRFENGSCIPLPLLIGMARAYNEENKNTIKLSNTLETLNPKKYKRYLLKEFSKRLDQVCDNQRCWLRQDFTKRMDNLMEEDLKKNTFRPKGPDGKFEWLNTFNIMDVMSQYEKKYKEFKFLGAVPIDFDDLPNLGIKDLDFHDMMEKGKTKFGIVFNLDEHYKSGSHWFSLFVDLNEGIIFFMDSYGSQAESRIRKLMRRIAKFIKEELNKEPIVDYCRVRHQKDGFSCGLYAISFIIKMLEGHKFEEICNDKNFDDKLMVLNREIFFT